MSKYHSVKSGQYHSKREAKRAFDLELLERIGEISGLEKQVRYEVIPKQDGERAAHYIADFRYREKGGKLVIEDSKGVKTPDYILKRKLMLFRHGIKVLET